MLQQYSHVFDPEYGQAVTQLYVNVDL